LADQDRQDLHGLKILTNVTLEPMLRRHSASTSYAILVAGKQRRIKTQAVLPCAETAMLFWAPLAAGQIIMRKVDGWRSFAEKPDDRRIDVAA
jgi:putative transposase